MRPRANVRPLWKKGYWQGVVVEKRGNMLLVVR